MTNANDYRCLFESTKSLNSSFPAEDRAKSKLINNIVRLSGLFNKRFEIVNTKCSQLGA